MRLPRCGILPCLETLSPVSGALPSLITRPSSAGGQRRRESSVWAAALLAVSKGGGCPFIPGAPRGGCFPSASTWEALPDWAARMVHRQRGTSAVPDTSSLQAACHRLLCTTLLLPAPGMALVPQADAGCAQHVFLLEGCDGLVVATALSCSGGFGSPEPGFLCQAAVLHQAGELRLGSSLFSSG